MRVTPGLTVLDTVYICNRAGGQNIPAVAFDGENYVAVWYDPGLAEGIVAARVTPGGAVLDSGVCLGPGDDDPDIASSADRSLAVWSRDYSGVWARMLDGQCQPLDTLFRVAPIAGSGTSPRICSDGQGYLAVWHDFGPTGDLDVFGRIVTGSGQMPEAVFSIARGSAVQKDPSLCFDGSRYLVAWLEGVNNIIAQLIGLDGKLIGGPFPVSDTSPVEHQYPAVAGVDGNYLAVWAEYHDGFDIYGSHGNSIGAEERGTRRVTNFSVSPNPFRSATRFSKGQSAKGMELRIYDIKGSLIRSFTLDPISSALCWREAVPPGVYFVRTSDGQQAKIVKLE